MSGLAFPHKPGGLRPDFSFFFQIIARNMAFLNVLIFSPYFSGPHYRSADDATKIGNHPFSPPDPVVPKRVSTHVKKPPGGRKS